MVLFYIDAEKEYVYVCLRKWSDHVKTQELIPNLEVDFYVSDCVKFSMSRPQKVCMMELMIGETNTLSIEIYTERLLLFLKDTFKKVWVR